MAIKRLTLPTASLILTLCGGLPILAQDDLALCDALAASPLDDARPADVAGVPFGAIDASQAEPTCRAAWEALSEPRAAFQLGRVLHQEGDLQEAADLYESAAAGGHVWGKINLAQVLIDLAKERAYALQAEAAEAGNVSALYNLGVMATDRGDVDAAIAYYMQAIRAGDAEAAYNLGVLYDEGELVFRDALKAQGAYEDALALDHPLAKINLAYLYLEKGRSEEQRAEALALFRSAAEDDGDINAGLQLALLIQDGDTAEHDESEALVLAALRDRDLELARWLQAEPEKLSARNMGAVLEEIGASDESVLIEKLRDYYAR